MVKEGLGREEEVELVVLVEKQEEEEEMVEAPWWFFVIVWREARILLHRKLKEAWLVWSVMLIHTIFLHTKQIS